MKWVGTPYFSDIPDGMGYHVPSARTDLIALAKTSHCVYCNQTIPIFEESPAVRNEVFDREISQS